jgi:hypothetical protein
MTTAISTVKSNTALTDLEAQAAAIAAAAQEDGANNLGRLLKFSKGLYLIATETVPLGKEYIGHVQHWTRGWVKFRGGSLIEHRVGRVADGFIVPEREALDDNDPSLWEKDHAGNPKDPWTKQSYLPLEDRETGEIVTFVSGSTGGRGAVSTLCSRAARHLMTMGNPIIKLAVESYKHKSFGRIDKPNFSIVGWTNEPSKQTAPQPVVVNGHDDMSDEIPF